jgi:hypothetical protein
MNWRLYLMVCGKNIYENDQTSNWWPAERLISCLGWRNHCSHPGWPCWAEISRLRYGSYTSRTYGRNFLSESTIRKSSATKGVVLNQRPGRTLNFIPSLGFLLSLYRLTLVCLDPVLSILKLQSLLILLRKLAPIYLGLASAESCLFIQASL